MRSESAEKILKNLTLPDNEQLPMTVPQQNMLDDVRTCLSIMEGNLMMPTPDLRDKLIKALGCSVKHAYEVIWLARDAIGGRRSTSKSMVRESIMEMMRDAHKTALTLEPEKKVEALVKIANTLARAFATNADDSDLLDIAQYLTNEAIRITTDPATIGIKLSDGWREEVEKMKRKYGIVTDADFEVVEDNSQEQ